MTKKIKPLKRLNFPYNKWEIVGYFLAILMPFPLGIFCGVAMYRGLERKNWKRIFHDPGLRIIIFSIIWMILILSQTLGRQYPWLYP